jgi:cell wall-associated NlpC family hydrolase
MISKLLPRVLFVCAALTLYSVSVMAQTAETGHKPVKQIAQVSEPSSVGDDDPIIVAEAELASAGEEYKPSKSLLVTSALGLTRYQPMLLAAIDQRLGSRYRWGSTGPTTFDCSGFVWSTFHSSGIDFERGSARTLWARFEAPAPEENYKFGTLVFFSRLHHVGIVVDEHGFYHASRHHGVVYAPFNKYWLAQIDGFRRVPLAVATQASASKTPVPVTAVTQ